MTLQDHDLFFLVGNVRSGTNWIGNILNLHPKIKLEGEFHLHVVWEALSQCMEFPFGKLRFDEVSQAAHDAFERMIADCVLAACDPKPGAYWLGDRTPRPFEIIVPNKPHFVVVRDGRDVMVSWTFHEFGLGGPKTEPFWDRMQSDIQAFAADRDHFRKHPERLFADDMWVTALAENWAKRIHQDIDMLERCQAGDAPATACLVRYEDVHRDPFAEAARMYRFLGLDPEEAKKPSYEDKTLPGNFGREDPTSHFRKGKVGDWSMYATPRFKRMFKELAGDALIRAGYERDMDW